MKVGLSALGTFLGFDIVLLVTGAADDIRDLQGAVSTHDVRGHFNSSDDRMADQQ